ncbi:DUF115 domain-containing protein [Paenibacillus silvae]|uniref:motility associated factor glycosyltransferase family protein n=1 Tax=Paenibacillus silvae TaxID=1325358 RepID=UPI0025A100D9|nr:6-hydroxymethylpterin diphosphokinase MptE-like protein [Paenibacillus silvae]MDM5281333.1 DUF115 domain-containing protein [Paenibacillus silvae]
MENSDTKGSFLDSVFIECDLHKLDIQHEWLFNFIFYKEWPIIDGMKANADGWRMMNQANVNILKERFPHINEKFNNINSFEELQSQRKVMHERVERDEEWLQAVNEIIEDSKIIFVYGFGHGISIADLLEQFPDRWIFIYEPDEALFYEVLCRYDISFLLEQTNLYWIAVGEDQLKVLFHLLSSYMQEKLAFIGLRGFLEDEMNALRDIRQEFINYNTDFHSNKFIENRFRNEWTQNYLYHLHESLTCQTIESMYNAFKGSTAIIVSSGPSLTEDIEWIRKIQDHALIIAAGSSVQALIKHQIRPHLCVIMDGHEVNNRIFSNGNALEAALLFTSSSYYEISERKKENKIYSIMDNDQVSQYFLRVDKRNVLMLPTPSVAGTAVQAAIFLGAAKVVFAGQDLSFPGQKVYSDGVDHFSEESKEKMLQKAVSQIENVQGGMNATDASFMSMKESIEALIKHNQQVQFYNSTRNGAVIEGAPFCPIEDIYEEIQGQVVEKDIVEQWMERNPIDINRDEIINLKSRLEHVQLDLSVLEKDIRNVRKMVDMIEGLSRTKPLKCHNVIFDIEEQWGKIVNREWFTPVFESLIPLELARFDQKLPSIVVEQDIISKAGYLREYLGQLLNELEEQLPHLEELLIESVKRVDNTLTLNNLA